MMDNDLSKNDEGNNLHNIKNLTQVLKTPDAKVRQAALWQFRLKPQKWALEPIIATLKNDADVGIRELACQVLWELGDKRAVAPLIEVLADLEQRVIRRAIHALAVLKDNRAVEHLIRLAETSPDSSIRKEAVYALGEIGDARAFGTVVKLLEDKDISVPGAAYKALGKLGNLQAYDILLKKIRDKTSVEGGDAAIGLGYLGDKRAYEDILGYLEHNKDETLRADGAFALGLLGDKRAIEPLLIALKDESATVRSQAAWALGQLGDEKVIEALTQVAENDFERNDYLEEVNETATEAIETIKNRLGHD